MRILFVSTQLPFPPTSGGNIKTYRLLKHWNAKYEVTFCCLLKGDSASHVAEFKAALGELRFISTPCDKQRNLSSLALSRYYGVSMNVYRNSSRQLAGLLVHEWSRHDMVFIDHYEMFQYVPAAIATPVVLHEHNAEYVMWQRLASLEKQPFKRMLIRQEAKIIQALEVNYCHRAQLILAAPNDAAALIAAGAEAQKFRDTYHIGEDEMLKWPAVPFEATECSIFYVGTLTWEANIDGLCWFLNEVWPAVQASAPYARFDIVGGNPDRRIVDAVARSEGVTLHGYVADLRPYYDRSRVFVCPLRFGSGIKVKVLNAMYRGLPVVTTPIGREGLQVENGKELFENDLDAPLYAKQVLKLLSDAETWTQMQALSRRASERYTWAELLANHDNLIESIVPHAVAG